MNRQRRTFVTVVPSTAVPPETEELIDNRYVIRRNTGRRRRSRRKLETRRIVNGRTNGGRALTLVVERTKTPTSWLIITGWPATPAERRRIED